MHPTRHLAPTVLLATLLLDPAGLAAQDSTLARARAAIAAGRGAAVRPELAARAKADPRSYEAAFLLGRALMAEGRFGEAADAFEKATRLDPRSAEAWYWLGAATGEEATRASKVRQPFLAKKVQGAFERAVQLDPAHLDGRMGLVRFYSMAPGFMGGSMDKARREAAEIRRRDPLRGALAAASIETREERWDAAAREYEAAIAAAPDSAPGYAGLAELHARRQQWDEAAAALGRWRARRPADMRPVYATGRLAALSGRRLEEGEQALAAYLRHAPGPNEPSLAAAHWRLGQVREHRGDRAGARREYEAALRLDPSLAGAKASLRALGS